MTAITLNLRDGCAEHFFAQFFTQFGDDVLPHVVAADVRANGTDQRQHAKTCEQRDDVVGQAVFGVQGAVNGCQQHGDTQAADHPQQDRQADNQPERLEQIEQFSKNPGRGPGRSGLAHKQEFLGSREGQSLVNE